MGISPSGRHVAFIGSEGRQLWVLDLEQNEPRIIQGVKQVRVLSWSPDSAFIWFSSRVNTKELLQKVPVQGGPATAICEVGYLTDIAVSDDASTVVYSSGAVSELWEVAVSGGTPKPVLSEIEKEEIFAEHFGGSQTSLGTFPLFLPSEAGERVLIFGIGFPDTPTQRMMVLDMDTRRREILPPGVGPVYSPTGHLMYGLGRDPRNLWALPFSLSGLRAEGEPFLIAQNGWQHSLSEDGALVYLEWGANPSQLVWRDRGGKEMGSIGAGDWPAISPDGSRVAFNRDDGDIWMHNLLQDNSRKVTADQAGDISPVWSGDGKRLLFSSGRAGSWDIWMTDLERVGGKPDHLTSSAELEMAADWSTNGKFVTYHAVSQGERTSLWFLEHDEQTGEWKPQEFLRTGRGDLRPRLSPDGRFVAYFSYVSGQAEVYVERFPGGGGQKLVSTNEGRSPRWRADGKELFYMGGGPGSGAKTGLFSVPVSTTPDFSVAGRPIRLFDVATSQLAYDVSADGQRFLFSEQPEETPEVEIRVVLNWYEDFRDREQ